MKMVAKILTKVSDKNGQRLRPNLSDGVQSNSMKILDGFFTHTPQPVYGHGIQKGLRFTRIYHFKAIGLINIGSEFGQKFIFGHSNGGS